MGFDLPLAQYLATVLLNLAAAVAAGASMSMLWLRRGSSGWSGTRLPRVRRAAVAGALVALLAFVAVLWLEAAAMAEVPLVEAGAAATSMLGATHYGLAWRLGAGALAAAVALGVFMPRRSARLCASTTLAALAVFWYTRSMVSHAASNGDFSLTLLADWAHLGLISLWVGGVLVAGLVTLAGSAPSQEADRRERAAYVAALSNSATLALVGIFVTGLFNVWHNLRGIGDLAGNPYGNTLIAKLAAVGIAALLGGFNRFVVMPPWLARERAGQAARPELPRRFRRVLQAEALVLLATLVLAAFLAATPPPGTAM